jgi:tetratricopeptide (TPR) repeat protein
VLALIIVTGAVIPACADSWYQHYDQAQRAIEDERWRDAVEQLNEALRRRGDSGVQVRTYGMKFTSYFPYLKLGIAYVNLEQLEAALRAFETEERLGAIQESPDDLAALQHYRLLAERRLADAAARTESKIGDIVSESLEQARILATSGRLDDALAAAARAVSVDPKNQEAQALVSRLREQAAEAEQAAAARARAAELLDEARARIAAGQLTTAASLLEQSVSLFDAGAARDLLDRVRSDIEALPSRPTQGDRAQAALERARRFRNDNDYESAIDALQPVLTADPSHSEANRLLARVLEERETGQRRARVASALESAARELEAGRFEASLSAANRALMLDSGNPEALQLIRSAYEGISRGLLGTPAPENIPPAIRFVDLRTDLDGTPVQLLDQPRLRLSGVVIDDSQVQIEAHIGPEPLTVEFSAQPVGEYTVTTFTVHSTLEPGRHRLRVAATDTEGLSSSSEYVTEYRRPLTRSPWVIAGLLTLSFIVLTALVVSSRRRRRRLLRRRFNPYIAGAPVLDDNLFYGREILIERILQTVHNNSLLLHGERRIGKTSLQHHLKRRLEALDDPDFSFFPVYIDLQGTPQERFFATLAGDLFQGLEAHLDGLEPGADPSGEYGYRDLVKDLRAVISRLQDTSSKNVKLVLLIDEVDELNDYDPRINQRLRSLFMKSFAENLVAVVSGVEIRKQWEREASPWFNFFEEIEVRSLEREHAEALITRPVRGLFRIEPDAVARIVELTDCRPYLIQKLCINLVALKYESGGRTITVSDVDDVGRPHGR